MKKPFFALVIVGLVSLLLFSGCGISSGYLGHSVQTEVELNQNNFKVVKHIQASASANYLFLLIPLTSQDFFAKATEKLHRQAELEGKPRALANVSTNVIWKNVVIPYIPIWGKKEIIISADVVEFIK